MQALPPHPPAAEQPAEPQYPFGGFVFSGPEASLTKLKVEGEKVGLRLKPYILPGQRFSLVIAGDDAFGRMDAVMALWNRASDGEFGPVVGGLISEPPPHW